MAEDNNDLSLLNDFAHDLRTPLNAARSFIDMIQQTGDLTDQQQHFANRALHALQRAQQLVDDLLQFARMENKLELKIVSCDLFQVLEEALALIEAEAQQKNIAIRKELDSAAQYVQADITMLPHVLTNLLSNAVKYNRLGGSITVRARLEADFVRVEVVDSGFGIPEAKINRVFERFYRANDRVYQNVEGTGLGLAIVKTVVEQQGGAVFVESVVDQGSTFGFTLLRVTSTVHDDDRESSDDLDDRLQEAREVLDDRDDDI